MFNVQSSLFLHLLRCALWDEKPDMSLFEGGADWQGIMEKAFRHTVQGLVAQQVKHIAETQDNETLVQACMKVMMQISKSNQKVNDVLVALAQAMQRCRFHAMLLKGQGVARYYPQPALRVCGDIDCYTGSQTDAITDRLAREMPGFEVKEEGNRAKHRNAEAGGIEIELHYHVFCPSDAKIAALVDEWSNDELAHRTRQIEVGGQPLTVPSATFDAIYIFIHFFFHFLKEGVGLRQVCDWLRCLHVCRDEIDHDEVRRWLKAFGLLHAWQLFGLMAVRHLGLPQGEMPLFRDRRRSAADKLMRMLVAGSNFGKDMRREWEANQPKHVLAHKWYSLRRYTAFYVPRAHLFPRQGIPRLLGYYKKSLKQIMNKHEV